MSEKARKPKSAFLRLFRLSSKPAAKGAKIRSRFFAHWPVRIVFEIIRNFFNMFVSYRQFQGGVDIMDDEWNFKLPAMPKAKTMETL